MTFLISSPAFVADGPIPQRYTVDGDDLSPPLAWTDLPRRTVSLALVVSDPDAMPTPRVHWIVYNIRPTSHVLAENASRRGLPSGAWTGQNDWGTSAYAGPRTPGGRHRYVHTLYALDTVLADLMRPSFTDLRQAIFAHVLATAELTGSYACLPKQVLESGVGRDPPGRPAH